MDLQTLKKLKVVKVLQRGGKSKYVKLLEKQVIKKAYDPSQPRQKFRFEKEVEYLTHLQYCSFVPKILAVDYQNPKKQIIYMTYVGKPIPNTPEFQERVRNTMKSLHLDWNLMRHKNGKPNYDIAMINATLLDGQVHIIDFGSPHYKIVGPQVTH